MNADETEAAVGLLSYPGANKDKVARRAELVEYHASVAEVELKFKDWLAEEYAGNFGEQVRDLIWNKAWEDGHPYGYLEIESQYRDYADFADHILSA